MMEKLASNPIARQSFASKISRRYRMTIESPDANDSYINFSGATNEMSLGFDTSDAAMYITNRRQQLIDELL